MRYELVAGTSYPMAKAERLPAVACRYTEAELQLRLLGAALETGRADPSVWRPRLDALATSAHDRREVAAITEARARLADN